MTEGKMKNSILYILNTTKHIIHLYRDGDRRPMFVLFVWTIFILSIPIELAFGLGYLVYKSVKWLLK